MNGILCIDKPVGIVSFKTVGRVRFITKEKRVGFAGTLDPFASGLLIMGIGKTYTRQLDSFLQLPKTYEVDMVLGMETDSFDAYGRLTKKEAPAICPSQEDIEQCFQTFLGEQQQIPPQFSAKKIKGKAAYHYARQGEEVELKPSTVSIYSITLHSIYSSVFPVVTFTVHCSKGTYIRSLVRDMARQLGTVGYARRLCRQKIGTFDINQALKFDDLNLDTIQASLLKDVVCA